MRSNENGQCDCHGKKFCPDKYVEVREINEEDVLVIYHYRREDVERWEAQRQIGAFI